MTSWTSPDKFLQVTRPKKPTDILHSPNRSLAFMKAEAGETTVRALLVMMIGQTVQFLNVGKTMSAEQIIQTADLILDDEYYSVHKPDYFVLCFNRAKKGQYGKQYDRIDGQVVFEWLAQFDYEYSSEIEAQRVNEQRKIQRDTVLTPEEIKQSSSLPEYQRPVPMPENVKETIRNLGRKVIPATTKVVNTAENEYFQGLITQFKMLCFESIEAKDGLAKTQNGQDFLKVGNRWLTCNEYLQHRVLTDGDGRH